VRHWIVQPFERLTEIGLRLAEATHGAEATPNVSKRLIVARHHGLISHEQIEGLLIALDGAQDPGELEHDFRVVRIELERSTREVLAPLRVDRQVRFGREPQEKDAVARFARQLIDHRIGVRGIGRDTTSPVDEACGLGLASEFSVALREQAES